MKKIMMLVSALALTACGGGGGSSHSAASSSVYVPPRAAVTSAVVSSNAQITNMPSEVVVASNSTTPVSVASVTTNSGGVTYTSYRLDDVKLFMAENLDEDGHSYVNLELNEATGEIDAVKMKVGSVESGRNEREKNSDGSFKDTFAGPIFEYVKGGSGEDKDHALFRVVDNGEITMADLDGFKAANNLPDSGHWNRVDEKMAFSSLGNTVGLQYSDFGHFNPVYKSKHEEITAENIIASRKSQTEAGHLDRAGDLDKYRDDAEFAAALAKEDYQLFAGGYAIDGVSMVDTLTPEAGATYSGTAIGRVYASIQGGSGAARDAQLTAWGVPSGQDGHDMAKAYTTSAATMTIGTDGSQTLFMPFNAPTSEADRFYNVTIIKATADAAPEFTFDAPQSVARQYQENDTPIAAKTEKDFTPGYYGVNIPVEAAGTARYYTEQKLDTEAGITREWEFQAAYGMKKD